jgi:hypothetical protein
VKQKRQWETNGQLHMKRLLHEAPVRSKDMRGHALRMAGRRPVGLRRRDFSFRLRATEHRLDSLHSTLNVSKSYRKRNILDDDRGPRWVIFRARRAGKKVTKGCGVFGRIASKG